MMHGETRVPDYRFYVDYRRGGEAHYSVGPPRDGRMRILEDLLTVPVFLGGKDRDGHLHYRATAFFVGMPTTRSRFGWPCLVTARHNILKAEEVYRNVWVRMNTRDGGAEDIEITTPWVFPEDASSDIAAIPFFPPAEFAWESLRIPPYWFVTEAAIEGRGIGIGDDLVVMGLFANHTGRARNLPIVRSGNLASMPLEPLVDNQTGGEYNAYLAEVRSIGGLSGSPVFVALNAATRVYAEHAEKAEGGPPFLLLGIIRGHWEREVEADFGETEFGRLNTGIAIVTPIADVLPLFEREEFVSYRDDTDKGWDRATRGVPVDDWNPEEDTSEDSEFERFENLTRKLVNVPKGELDEKRRED